MERKKSDMIKGAERDTKLREEKDKERTRATERKKVIFKEREDSKGFVDGRIKIKNGRAIE